MRGFGSPQACYAYEAQMDRLAAALGMDPVTIRRRNLIQGWLYYRYWSPCSRRGRD